jgi:ApeA N-terminal domain 1
MIVEASVLRKKMSIDSRVQTKCSGWRALLPGESVYGAQSAFGAPLEDEMAVLEARGFFWWHGEEIPASLLAPESHVPGVLRIDDVGRIELELDGQLRSDHGPMARVLGDQHELKDKQIAGLLKETSQYLLLYDLARHGGRVSFGGVSYDGYAAMDCLVGDSNLIEASGSPLFQELLVDLVGLEEWFSLGTIQANTTEGETSAVYKKQKDITYKVEGGKVSIEFDVVGPGMGASRHHHLELK